jgi:hypothetical protein
MRFLIFATIFIACLAAEKPWLFSDLFQGEWQVDKVSYESLADNGLLTSGTLNVTSATLPGVYLGAFKPNDNSPGFSIRVEPDGDSTGLLKFFNADENTDFEETILLEFQYTFKKTTSLSVYIHDGTFKLKNESGIVEFFISTPYTWTLTVRYDQGPIKLIRWIGRKAIPEAPASFLGRWGFSIILAGFFIATRFIFTNNKTARN